MIKPGSRLTILTFHQKRCKNVRKDHFINATTGLFSRLFTLQKCLSLRAGMPIYIQSNQKTLTNYKVQ
jgi:hypothetical protein